MCYYKVPTIFRLKVTYNFYMEHKNRYFKGLMVFFGQYSGILTWLFFLFLKGFLWIRCYRVLLRANGWATLGHDSTTRRTLKVLLPSSCRSVGGGKIPTPLLNNGKVIFSTQLLSWFDKAGACTEKDFCGASSQTQILQVESMTWTQTLQIESMTLTQTQTLQVESNPNIMLGWFLFRKFDLFNFDMVSCCSILFTDFGTLVFAVGPLLPLSVIFFDYNRNFNVKMSKINKMAKNHFSRSHLGSYNV